MNTRPTTDLFSSALVRVHDHLLYDPSRYQEYALSLPYADIPIGEDIFRGIAQHPDPASDQLRVLLRALCGDALDVHLSFFRKSPAGQREPTYLHSDAVMGDVTAMLYLHPDPPSGDGTVFWERRSTGHIYGPWDAETEAAAQDLTRWTPWRTVDAQFGRLLLFRADLYHSRALVDNYGDGDQARLTQVAFARWRRDVPEVLG